MDKLLHLSTRTWVFEARFCHRTWVSKTWDASFLHGFKTLLTNDILSPHSASLQIPSRFDFWFSEKREELRVLILVFRRELGFVLSG